MGKIPLLLLSDNPASSTGLGRITRELALRIHANLGDTFDLATYGLGGVSSKNLPWAQYIINRLDNWVPPDLPRVWRDHAGERKGVVLCIWNPSSLVWLADPSKLGPGLMKDFLMSDPFERWIYAPIDAEGPNGLMPKEVKDVCSQFDRTLFYTKWAADMFVRSIGGAHTAEHLPHGIDTKIFYSQDKQEARKDFVRLVTGQEPPVPMPVHDSVFLMGCIATNSARKDYELIFRVCQELRHRNMNVVLWAHTDAFRKHWNLPALAEAYGMENRVVFTNTDLSDEQMAEAYAACDVTIAPGLGEGFGLPIFESLACGIPCFHGDYAGAAEFLPEEYKVKPVGWFSDGWYGHQRPVFREKDWADAIEAQEYWDGKTELPKELDWDVLWPRWEKWLLEGVNG
jgi:glycosyltransferase involved in cell wall biosynthesis